MKMFDSVVWCLQQKVWMQNLHTQLLVESAPKSTTNLHPQIDAQISTQTLNQYPHLLKCAFFLRAQVSENPEYHTKISLTQLKSLTRGHQDIVPARQWGAFGRQLVGGVLVSRK